MDVRFAAPAAAAVLLPTPVLLFVALLEDTGGSAVTTASVSCIGSSTVSWAVASTANGPSMSRTEREGDTTDTGPASSTKEAVAFGFTPPPLRLTIGASLTLSKPTYATAMVLELSPSNACTRMRR